MQSNYNIKGSEGFANITYIFGHNVGCDSYLVFIV